jgi:hypothetical protein
MRSALFEPPSKTIQEAAALPRIYAGSSLQHAMGWPLAPVHPSLVHSQPNAADDEMARGVGDEAVAHFPPGAENHYPRRGLGVGYGNLGSVASINLASRQCVREKS